MRKVTLVRLLRLFGAVAGVAGLAVLASHLLGGPISVVRVAGTSMEPALHAGDAVVVRKSSSYAPGDIVAYRSSRLDAEVLHRIVEERGRRYSAKGDSNDWVDPETIPFDSIIGRHVVTVPLLGRVAPFLSGRGGAGMAVATTASAAAWGARLRRRRKGPVTSPREVSPASILLTAGACAIGCAAVLGTAVVTRGSGPVPVRHSYSHVGGFAYSAEADPGVAYPSGALSTGDPVFRRLVRRLQVSFSYDLETSSPHEISGRTRLAASIGDGLGWAHVIPLSGWIPLEEGHAVADGTLDLSRVQEVIDEMETTTGLTAQTYTLELLARTEISGDIAGEAVSERFAPRFPLSLDHVRLQPAADPNPDDGVDPRQPRETRAVEAYDSVGRSSIFDGPLRTVAFVGGSLGLLLSVGTIVVVAWRRRANLDDSGLIRAACSRRLVAADVAPAPVTVSVVDVADAAAFADLARSFDFVLEVKDGDVTSFQVHDGHSTYRYVCRPDGDVDGRASEAGDAA